MADGSAIRDKFRGRKWLWIPSILLAIVFAYYVRWTGGGRSADLPDTEPVIKLVMHKTGETEEMPLESYLEGVVAAEMDPSWPMEALKAQAIVARTFTLKKMGEGVQASTDPDKFQAYDAGRVNDRVRQAVRDTRGQVVLYGQKPINAWFHASSGGVTASAVEGLGYKAEATPYVAPKADVQTEPTQKWYKTFSNEAIAKAASQVGAAIDKVTSIKIGKTGPSGRAETLVVNDKEVPAPAFRVALGAGAMRSTLLDGVAMSGDTVTMQGRGYGHGVGLSQWGAWIMALRGKAAQEIVKFYYKGVSVEKVWE